MTAPAWAHPCYCSLWVLGAAGCALAPSFPSLLLCRLLVGAAVGPFIALAAPLIDDQAPSNKKSTWLATLFLCIPVGFALGYIYGGLVRHRSGKKWQREVGQLTLRWQLSGHQLVCRPTDQLLNLVVVLQADGLLGRAVKQLGMGPLT